MDWIELPIEPRHIGVPSGASKRIFEAMLCFAQTVHISCTDTYTISKRTERDSKWPTSPRSCIRCVQNDFMSLWYIRCKPYTYLASRWALSRNGLKWASTWASQPRSAIGCIQNDFWATGMLGTSHAPILHQHQHCLQMDQNEIAHDPRHLGVPSGASKTISKPVVHSAQTVHLSCVKISTITKQTESSFYLTTSPRSTIGCIQNDFWGYVMFGTNYAPILHRHLHCLETDRMRFHMTHVT
jgi:hypothetical protein